NNDGDFFDNYEKEKMEEVKSYCTDGSADDEELYINLWENAYSPAIYLTSIEENNKKSHLSLKAVQQFVHNRIKPTGPNHRSAAQNDTESVKPIKQSAYRILPDEQDFLEKEIKKLLENGLIYKVKSPWTSPI
ncbi:36275_t:CDS:2, partial [Racocetra persica]